PPVAMPYVGAVNEDATLANIALNGVIQFFSDADADLHNLHSFPTRRSSDLGTGTVTQGAGVATSIAGTYGHLTLNADGSYSYVGDTANTPATGATADDVCPYTVKDHDGLISNPTTLTITVTGTDDAPVANPD